MVGEGGEKGCGKVGAEEGNEVRIAAGVGEVGEVGVFAAEGAKEVSTKTEVALSAEVEGVVDVGDEVGGIGTNKRADEVDADEATATDDLLGDGVGEVAGMVADGTEVRVAGNGKNVESLFIDVVENVVC